MRATARWAVAFLCASVLATAPVRAQETANAPVFTPETGWTLRLPAEDKLVFRGVVSLDGVGANGGAMMYPAPNAAGFLAGLITHAILVDSAKNSQKQKLQEAADKVLEPYLGVVDALSLSQTMQRAVEKARFGRQAVLETAAQTASTDWTVEVLPVFSMTRDERGLILDAAVVARRANQDQPALQATVRVVSTPRDETDIRSHWMAEDGLALKKEVVRMLADALDIALGIPTMPANPAAQKTFRYRAGAAERFERAELILASCERLVVRNLRGTLMSIPVQRDAQGTPQDCPSGQPT